MALAALAPGRLPSPRPDWQAACDEPREPQRPGRPGERELPPAGVGGGARLYIAARAGAGPARREARTASQGPGPAARPSPRRPPLHAAPVAPGTWRPRCSPPAPPSATHSPPRPAARAHGPPDGRTARGRGWRGPGRPRRRCSRRSCWPSWRPGRVVGAPPHPPRPTARWTPSWSAAGRAWWRARWRACQWPLSPKRRRSRAARATTCWASNGCGASTATWASASTSRCSATAASAACTRTRATVSGTGGPGQRPRPPLRPNAPTGPELTPARGRWDPGRSWVPGLLAQGREGANTLGSGRRRGDRLCAPRRRSPASPPSEVRAPVPHSSAFARGHRARGAATGTRGAPGLAPRSGRARGLPGPP